MGNKPIYLTFFQHPLVNRYRMQTNFILFFCRVGVTDDGINAVSPLQSASCWSCLRYFINSLLLNKVREFVKAIWKPFSIMKIQLKERQGIREKTEPLMITKVRSYWHTPTCHLESISHFGGENRPWLGRRWSAVSRWWVAEEWCCGRQRGKAKLTSSKLCKKHARN